MKSNKTKKNCVNPIDGSAKTTKRNFKRFFEKAKAAALPVVMCVVVVAGVIGVGLVGKIMSTRIAESKALTPSASANGTVYFNVPECVYLTPSTANATTSVNFQYVLDQSLNTSTGAVTPNKGYKAISSGGTVEFYASGATSVTLSCSGATCTVGKTGSQTLTDHKLSTSITAGSAKNENGLITWTAVCNGVTYTAYTYIYKPQLNAVAAIASGRTNSGGRHRTCAVTSVIYGAQKITCSRTSAPMYAGSTEVGNEGDEVTSDSGVFIRNLTNYSTVPPYYAGADGNPSISVLYSSTDSSTSNSSTGGTYSRYETSSYNDLATRGGKGVIYFEDDRVSSVENVPNLHIYSIMNGTSHDNEKIGNYHYYAYIYTGTSSSFYGSNSNTSATIVSTTTLPENYNSAATQYDCMTDTVKNWSISDGTGLLLYTHEYHNAGGNDRYSRASVSVDFVEVDKSSLRSEIQKAISYGASGTNFKEAYQALGKPDATVEEIELAKSKIQTGTVSATHSGVHTNTSYSKTLGSESSYFTYGSALTVKSNTYTGYDCTNSAIGTTANHSNYTSGNLFSVSAFQASDPRGDSTSCLRSLTANPSAKTIFYERSYDKTEGYSKNVDNPTIYKINVLPSTSYTFSWTANNTNSKTTIAEYTSLDTSYISNTNKDNKSITSATNTFTTGSTTNYVGFRFGHNSTSSKKSSNVTYSSINFKFTRALTGGSAATVSTAGSGHSATRTYTYAACYYKTLPYTFTYTPHTYTATYNANNGSGTVSSTSGIYDEPFTLSSNEFSRSYTVTYDVNGGNALSSNTATATYTQDGWATSASGAKAYSLGQSFSGTTLNGFYSANRWSETGKSATLYAHWTGGSVTLPTPTRTGYTFNGWYTASSGGTKVGAAGASYTPTANATLYAQWTVNPYTLTLDLGGGTMNKNLFYFKNNTATQSEGSASSITGTETYEDDGDIQVTGTRVTGDGEKCLESNIMVYLQQEHSYTLHYDANSSDAEVFLMIDDNGFSYNRYNWIGAGKTVTKTFTCDMTSWSNNGADKYSTGTGLYHLRIDENTQNTLSYTISNLYIVDNTDGKVTQYYGTTRKIGTPTRTGYTFSGWTLSGSGNYNSSTGLYTFGAGEGTLTAQWTAKKFDVQFNYNGGHENGTTNTTKSYSTTSSSAFTYDSGNYTTVTWLNPERTGYTFKGWYTAESGGTQVYDKDGKAVTTNNNGYWSKDKTWCYADNSKTVIFYAQWQANTYTVTLDNLFSFDAWKANLDTQSSPLAGKTDGDTLSFDADAKSVTVTSDNTSNPGKDSTDIYTTHGESSGYYNMPAMPNTKHQFSCTMTLGGSNSVKKGSYFVFNQTSEYRNGTNWCLTSTQSETKGGNIVKEFTTPSDCAYLQFRCGVNTPNTTMTISNIRIVPLEDSNGNKYPYSGYGVKDVAVSSVISATYNSALTVSDKSCSGYTFEGWYTTPGILGDTTGAKVTSGSTYTTAVHSNLYSRWTAKTPTVEFDANGGKWSGGSTKQSITETYGKNYTLPSTDPTRPGYDFNGWWTIDK